MWFLRKGQPMSWFDAAALADLEREIAGCERRLAELKDSSAGEQVVREAEQALANARAALAAAKKRPKPKKQ